MSHDTCPTVKVKFDNEQGYIVINEEDFDAEKHALFDTQPQAEPQSEPPQEDPKPWEQK